jgi:ABC-type microcin C transport system permease subunit YejE
VTRRGLCLFLISLSLICYLIIIDRGIREISLISELRTNQKPLLPEMYLKMYLKMHVEAAWN